MDIKIVERFNELWKRYFGEAELPIVFFYSDLACEVALERGNQHCAIAQLSKVRRGVNLRFDTDSVNCVGGKRYFGFTKEMNPNFNLFLSHGLGNSEKYKKSPELVQEYMSNLKPLRGVEKNIIFKRWDRLEAGDNPAVVIFFASPDILSGLYTLTTYDSNREERIVAPFGSGCASILYFPFRDYINGIERATLGMFDPSARKCVKDDIISFSVPINLFLKMIDNMEESFLTTDSWEIMRNRINKSILKKDSSSK